MRKSNLFLCFVFLVGMVIVSGCTRSDSTPVSAPTPTQQVTPVTVLGTPVNVATQSEISSSKYKVGDIIWKEPSMFNSVVAADMGVIILSADAVEQNYTIDYIFRDANTTTWYRLYPDPKTDPMSVDNELYPYLVGNVEISAIVTKYSSEDAFAAQMEAPVPTTLY